MKQLSFEQLDSAKLESKSSGTKNEKSWIRHVCEILDVELKPGWPDQFGKKLREYLHTHNREPIQVLSLFSGGGGLDIAFNDTGFHSIEMIEIEEKYANTLIHNARKNVGLQGSRVNCIDIRDYQPPDNLKVDFVIGGPPCQTFSAAGRRASGVLGTTDPRGTLFEEYIRLLQALKPRGFLFENVYGIVGANKGKDWAAIIKAFEETGYHIFYRILDSADYGVPQHRERLIIVGLDHGEFLFPYPTHGPDSINCEPYYVAGEAVKGLETSHLKSGINGKYGHLLDGIPPGLNYSFYTEKLGHPRPVFGWRSKFSDFLYKADPEMPVRTIKAQGGQYTGPFSWENRPFSIDELKRLQTFPDDYEIIGNQQIAVEQIGNSVPPQIGRILALSILDQIFNVSLPFEMQYMKPNVELGFRQRKRELTKRYKQKAKEAIASIKNINQRIDFKATEKRYLSTNFAWSKLPLSDTTDKKIELKYLLNGEKWEISASEESIANKKQCYEIIVTASEETGWVLPIDQISLYAFDFEISTFTALWKALEEKIYEIIGVADLVQLNGYYQYTPRIFCRMNFPQPPEETFWNTLQLIVHGVGVAKELSEKDLADIFNIPAAQLLELCEMLRQVGYEVRNHNTNPQILRQHYLIPYGFPTFTPRSVQLHKNLRGTND